MRKNVLFILLFASLISILSTGSLYSQDSTLKVAQNEFNELSIYYNNKRIVPKEGNEINTTGNNFICLEINNITPLNKSLAVELAVGFQFGNITGINAYNIYFKPGLMLLGSSSESFLNRYIEADVSSAIIILSANNGDWKYGGFGINPALGVTVKIYNGIRIILRSGAELYPNISYFAISAGLSYRWQE